ncbi:putative membrane protein, partial [Escherichia coli EC1865]
MHKNIFLYYEN